MKTAPRRLLSLLSTGGVPPGALAAAAILLLPLGAQAASGSWSGANGGNWNDAGNWAPGIPGATSGSTSADVATFYGVPANRTITVDAGRNVSGISFAASATNFVIGSAAGNTLTLSSGGNVTFNASASFTGITEAVNAPLFLAGAYTFANNNTMASGNILSFGGLISSNNTALAVNGAGRTIFNSNVSIGTATLTKSGAGLLEINGDLALGRLNVTSGTTVFNGANLALSAPSNNYINVDAGAVLQIASGSVTFGTVGGNAFGGNGSVLQTGGSVLVSGSALMNQVSFGGVVADYTISGGSYTMDAANSLRGLRSFTAKGNSTVTINSTLVRISENTVPAVFTIDDNASVTFANAVTLTHTGSSMATVVLNGGTMTIPGLASTASGTSKITFNGGVLRFSGNAAINSDLQVKTTEVGDDGAIFDTNGFNVTFSRALTAAGSGGLTKVGSGTLTLGAASTYTGATVVNGGELRAGVATSAFGDQSAVVMANAAGATLNLANFSQTIGSLAGGGASGGNVVLGTGTLTVGGNNANTSYAGVISGSGAVSKVGTGTLTIAGTQTYTGTTMVSVGTLIVNGQLGSGGVVVSGGKLGGNITVTGLTTIASGGTLAVGNSPGTGNFSSLNLSGAAATSVTEMQLNAGATGAGAGTTYDTINVSTALAYGGELRLVFNGAIGSDTFDLFSFGALTPGGDFGSISLYANSTLIGTLTENAGAWTGVYNLGFGSGSQSFTFTNASGDLVVAVPEPGTWLLFGLGLGVVLLRKRRVIR